MSRHGLWVGVDGLVTLEPIEASVVTDHEHWCDVIRDVLLERRWEEAHRMMEKHDDDELTTQPQDTYSLPLIVTPTREIARQLRVMTCKMGIGPHPLLAATEHWYYLPNFDGGIGAIWAASGRMKLLLERM